MSDLSNSIAALRAAEKYLKTLPLDENGEAPAAVGFTRFVQNLLRDGMTSDDVKMYLMSAACDLASMEGLVPGTDGRDEFLAAIGVLVDLAAENKPPTLRIVS